MTRQYNYAEVKQCAMCKSYFTAKNWRTKRCDVCKPIYAKMYRPPRQTVPFFDDKTTWKFKETISRSQLWRRNKKNKIKIICE